MACSGRLFKGNLERIRLKLLTIKYKIMYTHLSKQELIDISGGHDGKAYEAGEVVGEIIKKVRTILGFAGAIRSLIR